MWHKKQQHFSAITLTELLIAMTLLTIISGICYGALKVAFSFWEYGDIYKDAVHQGQLALRIISRDLHSAYIPKVFPANKNYFQGILLPQSEKPPTPAFHFIKIGGAGPAEAGYFFRYATSGGELCRRYNPVAYTDVKEGEPGDGEITSVLLKNIQRMNMQYLDQNGNWNFVWPPADSTALLPKAVKIEIVFWLAEAQTEVVLPTEIININLGR